MSRRPLYLLAPAFLACALGYFAWPESSALGTNSPKEQAAEQTASNRDKHESAQQPMNGVATKARYKLTFEHRSTIDGKEAVVVEIAGTWTTIERAGGDIEAQFAASRIAIKGDEAPSNQDVADSFTLKMHDGGLLAVAFAKGTTDRAHNLLVSIATALQYTNRPGQTWTVEEQDLMGKYEATYNRVGQRVQRKRGAYTQMTSSNGSQTNGNTLQSTEDSSFLFDEKGLVSATIKLDQQSALGQGLPTIAMALRVKLERIDSTEVPLVAAPFRDATSIAPRVDRGLAERNRRLSIVAGATMTELLEAAKSAAHLGEDAPLRYREQAKAMRRLTALVELEPTAANELAAAIKKDPSDLDSARLLSGALSSAESPQATNALSSLLGDELPEETKSTVLMNLGLAKAPTVESTSALTKALDGPLGNQAALALGSQAHTLGEEDGAGAVDTLLSRYEAAKTSEERLAYIEALANTGSREVLPVMHAAISGNDFTAARAGTLGLRLIPGDDVDDTLWGLIAKGTIVTLDAIKATGYRTPSVWKPKLEKAQTMYQGENRVLEAIQAVLSQWKSLEVAAPAN